MVSVIIPTYNQARFLDDAISSVLTQSYRHHEVIVVDDGSTDRPALRVARHSGVCLVRQRNRGSAHARETGLRHSRGEYVVFLDADDRLRPKALEVGIRWLLEHPECAFVSGQYVIVNGDGTERERPVRPVVEAHHYLELLRGNYVGMFATVMFRRSALESLPRLAMGFKRCDDYALLLAIARDHLVGCHGEVVAEYRWHGRNKSRKSHAMLRTVLSVLETEREHVAADPDGLAALADGQEYYRNYYGNQLVTALRRWERARKWQWVIPGLLLLRRHHPAAFHYHVRTKARGLIGAERASERGEEVSVGGSSAWTR